MWARRALWMLAVFAPVGLGAEEPASFVDHVATLELDTAIDSRGQLGGIAVDKLGFVYVANFRDGVWRVDPETGAAEVLSRGLYGSSGNALDSKGDLYQANFQGNTISRITRSGEISRFADAGLNGPVGIAVGKDDTLYVCNCSGNFIARVSTDGAVERLAEGDQFGCPNGITFGDDGHLYVTNFNHHDILKVTTEGAVSTFATVPGGAGNAHIAFSKGFFYVTKIVASQVVKVSKQGEVFPLAGSGQPGHDDGPGPTATFNRPNGIAVSPAGDRLYVNTLVGESGKPEPSTVALRRIDLVTLSGVLEEALEAGGVEAMAAAHARFRADPVRGKENSVAEMVTLGYSFLSGRRIPEAMTVFDLNADAYPESAAAQYHLGEAYRYTGRAEQASRQYREALAVDPEHALAASRLAQLEAAQ